MVKFTMKLNLQSFHFLDNQSSYKSKIIFIDDSFFYNHIKGSTIAVFYN